MQIDEKKSPIPNLIIAHPTELQKKVPKIPETFSWTGFQQKTGFGSKIH